MEVKILIEDWDSELDSEAGVVGNRDELENLAVPGPGSWPGTVTRNSA